MTWGSPDDRVRNNDRRFLCFPPVLDAILAALLVLAGFVANGWRPW